MASYAKVLLSECITIGLENMKIVLLGVLKVVGWLVLVGVNECILIKVQIVQNSRKTNTFLILWAFLLGSMSAFTRKSCLSGLGFGDSLV